MSARRRPGGPLLAAAVLALASGADRPTAAADAVAPATAHVTYLTASSVYVDAGREEGILQGDPIQVVREGQVIATLRVVFVSAHRASCSIVNAQAAPVVGDLVRYTEHRETPRAPESKEGESRQAPGVGARASRGGLAGTGIHGRIGVRYLDLKDRTGNDSGFSQPGLDVRLDGYALGGGPVDLLVDVRSYRTQRTLPTGSNETEGENRIYRASVGVHLDSRQQIIVGRQFAPALSVVSIFDGVLYALDGSRTGWGVFSGVQPDPVDLTFNSDIQEVGGYVQFKNAPDAQRRWALTTGAIGSYTQQTVNREFLFVQAQYYATRLSAYLAQEVDYNRAWKVSVAGESAISPTSTFANIQFRASRRFTLYTGYDNRRNVRLFHDRVTPLTEFDDSHRQGAWIGGSLRIGEHWFTSADARLNDGGAAGRSDGYSASFGVDGLTRANIGARGRSTRYSNNQTEGWLHSVGAGFDLGPHARLDLDAGRLQETNLLDSTFDRHLDWYSLDLDILLGRSWYWLLSCERNDGSQEKNDQIYAALTYRF